MEGVQVEIFLNYVLPKTGVQERVCGTVKAWEEGAITIVAESGDCVREEGPRCLLQVPWTSIKYVAFWDESNGR